MNLSFIISNYKFRKQIIFNCYYMTYNYQGTFMSFSSLQNKNFRTYYFQVLFSESAQAKIKEAAENARYCCHTFIIQHTVNSLI